MRIIASRALSFLAKEASMDNNPTRLLTSTEAAEFLRLKPSTLAKMRCVGGGPKYLRRGRCLYPLDELVRWIKARTVANTAEYGRLTEHDSAAA
jgi:Helix-turn-helix domain